MKECCGKAIAEFIPKRDDEKALVHKLSFSIDTASAESAKVIEKVATLQKELADLTFVACRRNSDQRIHGCDMVQCSQWRTGFGGSTQGFGGSTPGFG